MKNKNSNYIYKNYSSYSIKARSNQHKATKEHNKRHLLRYIVVVVVLLVGGYIFWQHIQQGKVSSVSYLPNSSQIKQDSTIKSSSTTPQTTLKSDACVNNSLSQLVVVSISQRHLWACDGSNQVYDTPVVTGIDYLAADITPTGTYHVYNKETDVYLIGSDTTGSWDDYVHYWMPFLQNQYGSYGFHDATWRPNSAFGNISPNSSNASHGCVEMPLAAAAWLYNWVNIGTTVTIES